MYSIDDVAKTDKDIADLIEAELARQNSHIELIASENWVSKAVMAAMGSPLTNKYAEGYPGKRFYGGCSCVDEVEALAIERAKELFGCEYANVQPHSEHRQTWQSFLQCCSRRYCNGYESGSWWTSDTWKSCKYVRNLLQASILWSK